MTTEHPITPPQDKHKRWEDDILNERENVDVVLASAWKDGFLAGADQELEACCEWIWARGMETTSSFLRAVLRPKPPSVKEQALAVIDNLSACDHLSPQNESILRRALEQLP